MRHDKLLVFDIETIPDSRHYSGKEFPPPAFHQVVAIAFLEADIVRRDSTEAFILRDLRAGGTAEYNERELLIGFCQHLERLQPRLVTYNGRSFDIRVLKYRGMSYSISCPLLSLPAYTYRYNIANHCDLLELLTDFGASTRMRLGEVCALFNLPAKLGIDGTDVARLYRSGKIEKIRDYCETDVLSSYLVYLRAMFHRGTLTAQDFEIAIFEVHQYLLKTEGLTPTPSAVCRRVGQSHPPAFFSYLIAVIFWWNHIS
jgi:3'-5' exonuclease